MGSSQAPSRGPSRERNPMTYFEQLTKNQVKTPVENQVWHFIRHTVRDNIFNEVCR